MSNDELNALVECPFDQMTTLFPDRTFADLKALRWHEQRRRGARIYKARHYGFGQPCDEPGSDLAEQRMREDAKRGSERLLQAMLEMVK